ncbi:MAG TPA: M1 family metallopeptidase [Caldilineaceae bacterium]|nr:M1 family metallopeptidase [Caldilineaceae bacterium]
MKRQHLLLFITQSPHFLWRFSAFVLPLWLLLVLTLLLNGCGGQPTDPLARFRPAMRPAFQQDIAALDTLPRYEMNIELFPEQNRLTGSMRVFLTNTSDEPWQQLVFRLYPELRDYGGNLTVNSAVAGGAKFSPPQALLADYQANNTAVSLRLPDFLRAGETMTMDIAWTLDYPVWQDAPTVYALFGKSQEMISLPLFYPSLAVYQPSNGLLGGGWWMDEGTVRGDSAFNVASLFVVTATLPANQVPVTSGTLITSTLIDGGRARHVWVTGPSREFLFHTSPLFQYASTEAYGTRVTSYWLPGQEGMGWAALRYAVASLRIFSDEFGPYPYRDMRVAPAPLYFRGMEYPQVSLLGVEVYNRYQDQLEPLLAHEVAHQWWYQIVHNDPVNEPWLDEALAEYSMLLYLEELRGDDDAGQLKLSRWDNPVRGMRTEGDATLINQAVMDFESSSLYETVIYAKGALFYDSIRQTLGDRRFKRFLRTYFADHRYGIVTTDDWLKEIRALNTPALEVLYEEWVRRPQPTPNIMPTPLPQRDADASAQR